MGLTGVFGDGRFDGTIQNVVRPTLVGLGAENQSPIAYRLVYKKTINRFIMFHALRNEIQ